MKHILVLVDFTDTADIALDQAIAFAKEQNALITTCHIAGANTDKDSLMTEMRSYAERAESQGVENKVLIGHGDFFDEVGSIIDRLGPDLIVVGTHGKHGIKQNLFGSAIHKLVKEAKAPTLVVNDHSKVSPKGYRKVLMPVAPHKDYLVKVEQTCQVLADDGEIVIFALLKPGVPLDEDIISNVEATKKYLDGRGVSYVYQEEDSDRYSVGYSKETISYVQKQDMDLISIMANVSDRNQLFGKMDKENVLLNELGIPVLCANH
ncbi:MAG: universal stress protein [Flavobacteriales bacterium]|nr:universal stress protein [Flavobacteriales bacterium]